VSDVGRSNIPEQKSYFPVFPFRRIHLYGDIARSGMPGQLVLLQFDVVFTTAMKKDQLPSGKGLKNFPWSLAPHSHWPQYGN
jgi:hypothetical protein